MHVHQPTEADDSRHLIEVRRAGSKGLGVFAMADIPRGTRVLAESALLEIDLEQGYGRHILQSFDRLSSSQQKSYLELHEFACDAFKREVERAMGQPWDDIPKMNRKVLSIIPANAFGAVFLLGSRFNHSCIPNVHFAYNTNLKRETFHAVRDIAAGEELTVMYIDGVNRERITRQNQLNDYGFTCSCPACEDTIQGKAKESKRVEMFKLDQNLATALMLGQAELWREGLTAVQKLAAFQVGEGLLIRELGRTYHDAAGLCVRLGRARMALLWAEKELEIDRCCVGEDHPDYINLLDVIERLKEAAHKSRKFDDSVIEWYTKESVQENCPVM